MCSVRGGGRAALHVGFVSARSGACTIAALGIVLLLSGRSVADKKAERIVSLAPSVTEMLFALGMGDRVVGVSMHCDYPPEVEGVDRIGTFLRPNVELILASKPDVVIGVPSPGNRTSVEMLQRLGLRVVVVDPEGVAETLAAIRFVAEVVGVPGAGERLVEGIERRMAAVTARLEHVPRRTVLMLVARTPFIAVGPGTYQDELIHLAGGANLTEGTGERWPNVSLEFVIAQAPEVIIDASMGSERDPKGDEFWQTFSTIPAVRHKRVHGYTAYQLLRPGPRIAETLETIARFIHPERFAGGEGARLTSGAAR